MVLLPLVLEKKSTKIISTITSFDDTLKKETKRIDKEIRRQKKKKTENEEEKLEITDFIEFYGTLCKSVEELRDLLKSLKNKIKKKDINSIVDLLVTGFSEIPFETILFELVKFNEGEILEDSAVEEKISKFQDKHVSPILNNLKILSSGAVDDAVNTITNIITSEVPFESLSHLIGTFCSESYVHAQAMTEVVNTFNEVNKQ